ncbi:MAG: hypothetical protein NTW86_30330 [Candidatus Sumerlaeota bacterium]|nr:hypothetical protein [Candidatus Sumerlaeota bacterium]
MVKLLHIAAKKPEPRAWPPLFQEALRAVGELILVENGEAMTELERAERIRHCDILLTSWGAAMVPEELIVDRGRLKYICHVTGTVRKFIPRTIIEAGIPATNWGDTPAGRVAEGAMTLLLTLLKDLPRRGRIIREGGWRPDALTHTETLEGLRVGVYGFGAIGRRFVDMLRPFRPVIRIFDPYVGDFPADCVAVRSLEELFANSDVIAIHAGLSDETRHSVTAELLAKLPDQGIVINTARGAIVDQAALFAELEKGRLRAGLDVLEPDRLPDGHPARQWENCILTAHNLHALHTYGDAAPNRLDLMHDVALDNIRRFLAGQPLRFVMDVERYIRST